MTDHPSRDFELAQRLAQQYTDDEEVERQRRIQIEAYIPFASFALIIADLRNSDEEFARQVQATLSPAQQRQPSDRAGSTQDTDSVQMDMDQTIKPSHSPTLLFPPSPFNQYNYSQMSTPQLSTSSSSSSPAFHQPSPLASPSPRMVCPSCFQERNAQDPTCWRCLTPFPTAAANDVYPPNLGSTQDQPSALQNKPIQVKQESDIQVPMTQFRTTQQMPVFPQIQQPYFNPLAHNQVEMMRRLQNEQLYMRQMQQIQAMQRAQMREQYMKAGSGTSSDPINLGDSPPETRSSTPQIQTFSPVSLPTVMNNGWPVPFPNPFAKKQAAYDPAQYLSRVPYDYPIPNPSADDIKELLANIRPEEDIKVEDNDAVIPGLSGHMRLMKHQQMGLAWMQKMEDGKNKGGLLADEMGLGKTIQRYYSERPY